MAKRLVLIRVLVILSIVLSYFPASMFLPPQRTLAAPAGTAVQFDGTKSIT